MRLQRKGSAGPSRTFDLFHSMSVLENIMVGEHCRIESGLVIGILGGKKSREQRKRIKGDALEISRFVGLQGSRGENGQEPTLWSKETD